MRRRMNWEDGVGQASSGRQWRPPGGARVGSPYRGTVDVIRVYYSSRDFTAIRVRDLSGMELSAVGRGSLNGIEAGTRMEMSGTWVRSKYGLQVDVGNVSIISLDQSLGYVESLITHCPKAERDEIGPILRDIYRVFGETMELSIRDGSAFTHPDCDAGNLLNRRIQRLAEEKRERDIRMATLAELHQMGINSVIAERLMEWYGLDAPDIVGTFPYEVAMETMGISLKVADNIAKKRDIPYDTAVRTRLLIAFALEVIMNEGHCFVPQQSFITGAADLVRKLDTNIFYDPVELRASVGKAIRSCEQDRVIVIDSRNRVYPFKCHEAEETISRNVVVRMDSSSVVGRMRLPLLPTEDGDVSAAITDVAGRVGIDYSDRQLDAVRAAVMNPISIISGGPGTGKTTICRAIVDVFEAAKMTVHLCSPTGRGARRLSESVDREASTIHRLLEFLPQSGEWRRNPLNQLACDALIVDEMSMVDVLLFKALLDAMPGVGRVVLVGDHDQLPSVGPGRVLRDLMESDIAPLTILDRIFRQAEGNDIVAVAHQVRNGIVPILPVLPDDVSSHGCWFVDEEDGDSIVSRLPHLMTLLADSRGVNPSDIQVLTPMRKGPLGTEILNIQLQEIINPPVRGGRDCRYRGMTFRTGDKVMQTRNDHQNEIYNGDIGRVVSSQSDGATVLFDGGQEVHYTGSLLDGLDHCWASTIHKLQGSEFPVGIILMHPSHSRMLRRNLLYTGVTRCTEQAVILGRMTAVTQAVDDNREQARCTSLAERIRDFNRVMRDRPDPLAQ